MTPIYELAIVDTNGHTYTVYGGVELVQIWKEHTEATFDSGKVMIEGHDESLRKRIRISLDREFVRGMILYDQS